MKNNNKLFNRTGTLQPGRSVFNLSYEKKFTCDMGQLIPVLCDEMVPGDFFELGNQSVLRFQPLVAPILHEINVFTHYFFVPYRILWPEALEGEPPAQVGWETFITGGLNGNLTPAIPEWNPTDTTIGSLWDFLGFPTGIDPDGAYPLDFPRRAYNMVWNEFYRDQNFMTEVALTNETILNRCWEKDYFSSALPWQQRGTAPALPISGTTSAIWDAADFVATNGQALHVGGSTPNGAFYNMTTGYPQILKEALDRNVVDLSTATTFDVADLRLAFQIQKWMERNARAGARYVEFLGAHFGVHPRDDRLQRPEYIGGSKTPVIISEVLQTSSTDATTPQGNLAGHGISVSDSYCGKYKATEFGVIIGLMSVMPRTSYQQGINRQWLRKTKYDFYFPEFANLSEQAIIRAEIMASAVAAENIDLWGYQGRYDEMRIKHNMICSEMRDTFDYWHLGRIFDPLTPPELNASFLECVPDKRIFAVQNEPGLIISFANIIKAVRPIPISAEPGLIDHN